LSYPLLLLCNYQTEFLFISFLSPYKRYLLPIFGNLVLIEGEEVNPLLFVPFGVVVTFSLASSLSELSTSISSSSAFSLFCFCFSSSVVDSPSSSSSFMLTVFFDGGTKVFAGLDFAIGVSGGFGVVDFSIALVDAGGIGEDAGVVTGDFFSDLVGGCVFFAGNFKDRGVDGVGGAVATFGVTGFGVVSFDCSVALVGVAAFVVGATIGVFGSRATNKKSTKKPDITAIKNALVHYKDWPKPGINFVDVHPVMSNPHLREDLFEAIRQRYEGKFITSIVAMESRGYYFGLPLAMQLGLPFIPLRKPKKLPGEVIGVDYGLEYGTDRLEIQKGRIQAGDSVLIVDDLLATGGTASAACKLVQSCGGIVYECFFVIELDALNGGQKLPTGVSYYSLLHI